MADSEKTIVSSALKANMATTAAEVRIPLKYLPLLNSVESWFGVHKRVKELLTELNHPFVNWEFVSEGLRSFSINDFYKFSPHPKGKEAISTIFDIYFQILSSDASEETKEKTLRFLFDFIRTLLAESKDLMERNTPLLDKVFSELIKMGGSDGSVLRKCSSLLKPILKDKAAATLLELKSFRQLTFDSFKQTYDFWLSSPDPAEWFMESSGADLLPNDENSGSEEIRKNLTNLLTSLSHKTIRNFSEKLEWIEISNAKPEEVFNELSKIPDYNTILGGYMAAADHIDKAPEFARMRNTTKLDYLFSVISFEHLKEIHTQSLQEINRSLTKAFQEEKEEHRTDFVKNTFKLLKKCFPQKKFVSITLNCMVSLAKEILETEDREIFELLQEEIIDCGFQYPEIEAANTEWQIQSNPEHIKNIRTWLEIISMRPQWTRRLLSALIINLKIGGVLIKDTDLFQRDITAYLNAGIIHNTNLSKQLMRIFPAFYNEIGAEGELRETSTMADEAYHRRDVLLHFIRKAIHVESNNKLTDFLYSAFRYWTSGDKECIRDFVPPEIFEQIYSNEDYFVNMSACFKKISEKTNLEPETLIKITKEELLEILEDTEVSDSDKNRAYLVIRSYQLLVKKYNPKPVDLLKDLKNFNLFSQINIKRLSNSLENGDTALSLQIVLDFLDKLQEIILSPEQTEPDENIYFKRHIAAGIPSMYGVYKEAKFDAMSLSLKLESLGKALFEQLAESMKTAGFITKSSIMKIHSHLPMFAKALALDGIPQRQLAGRINMLKTGMSIKLFSIDQYLDIFLGISKVIQDIIKNYYIDVHRRNMPVIIKQLFDNQHEASTPYPAFNKASLLEISENFSRSLISSAFSLQVLDNLIENIINILKMELEKFKDQKAMLNLVITYNPDITLTQIYEENSHIDNQILLGNKAYWLKRLASFGFPVPRCFIITTEVYRCFDAVMGYSGMLKDLNRRINLEIKKLEEATGKQFASKENPLFLSVRSGAAISMPGMMDTFLNVGINEEICESLSQNPAFAWAAWDSYRRFLQSWGMNEGLSRDFFDRIIYIFKSKFGIEKKLSFSPQQMRDLAMLYKENMAKEGVIVEENPMNQLSYAVMQTFASWNSPRARVYRKQMNISNDWGTAVTVQTMVFGNLNEHSGSGVTFTKDPQGSSQDVRLFGDFFFGVQGDDIVSGLIETFPISEYQRIKEKRNSNISLETKFPDVYKRLLRLAESLIKEKGFGHQEIEFTFEGPTKDDLYILQTRDQYQEKETLTLSFKPTQELLQSHVGTGVGVSGSAMAGRAVFKLSEIEKMRKENPGDNLILIRPDTVPEDVPLLMEVEGILTARGGRTSHAAVTIPQLGKVGVVGFNKLRVFETESCCYVDDRKISSGDWLSIDGRSGSVYLGKHEPDGGTI